MSGDAGEMDGGDGFAGEDNLQAFTPNAPGAPPQALAYDGTEYEVTELGDLASVSPTVAKVRLALLVAKGEHPADPALGFDWATPFQTGEKLTADVTARIYDALFRSAIIIGSDIEVVRIAVTSKVRGRVRFVFTFKDLRSGAEDTIRG